MNLVLFGPQWIADNSIYALLGFLAPFVALWLAAQMFRRSSADFADYL